MKNGQRQIKKLSPQKPEPLKQKPQAAIDQAGKNTYEHQSEQRKTRKCI